MTTDSSVSTEPLCTQVFMTIKPKGLHPPKFTSAVTKLLKNDYKQT